MARNLNEIKKKIETVTSLPSLPEVASKLLKAVNDPNTSASQISNIVSSDPSLAAKALRLANSAFYGIPKTITTVQNAVVILGLRVINSIVLNISLFEMFKDKDDNKIFDARKFWKHSVYCGTIAKMLAHRFGVTLLLNRKN